LFVECIREEGDGFEHRRASLGILYNGSQMQQDAVLSCIHSHTFCQFGGDFRCIRLHPPLLQRILLSILFSLALSNRLARFLPLQFGTATVSDGTPQDRRTLIVFLTAETTDMRVFCLERTFAQDLIFELKVFLCGDPIRAPQYYLFSHAEEILVAIGKYAHMFYY
jgi:hypothetical protein